eukprot:g841.t1
MPKTLAPRRRVEVLCLCAKGIKNTQYLMDQDPYVKARMCGQDPVSEARTRALPGGGTSPTWEDCDDNRLQLDLRDGATHIEIELWNANMVRDDLIGNARIELALVKQVTDTQYEMGLDTGGTITIQFHYPLSDEQRRAKGAGKMLDGAFDERKSKSEFQAALKQWREGSE